MASIAPAKRARLAWATPVDPSQTWQWLVAASLPALMDASVVGTLGWSAGMILGAVLAGDHKWRWLAVGWVVSASVPGSPLMAVAAAGLMGGTWQGRLLAAGAGPLIVATLPQSQTTAAAVLLGTALVALLGSRR